MKSREIALCGMLNALAVVVMNLGSIVPLATFCTPLIAMLVLLPVMEEFGAKMGWAAWFSVSVLSLLLVTDRETALVYVFFGWWPMVRPKVAALGSQWLAWRLKLPAILFLLLQRLRFVNLERKRLEEIIAKNRELENNRETISQKDHLLSQQEA